MRFFSAAFGRLKAGLLGFFRSKRAATDGKNQQNLEPRRGLDAGEQARHESERLYRILVENTSDIITLMDADGTVHYESAAFERVMGYLPEEPVGTNAFDWIHPDDVDRALSIFAEVLGAPGLHPPLEFRVPHRDGSWRYLEHTVNNLLDDPDVRGVVVTSRDVTERRELEEQLRHQAFHDPLTNLPNRALFMNRLEHVLACAGLRGERSGFVCPPERAVSRSCAGVPFGRVVAGDSNL